MIQETVNKNKDTKNIRYKGLESLFNKLMNKWTFNKTYSL